MNDNKYTIDMSISLDSPYEVLDYFHEVFEFVIKDIVRLYSIYYHLSKKKKTLISFDYYNLTLINLRKLFEPKMKSTVIVNLDANGALLPKAEYQLNFMQWINSFYTVFNSIKIEDNFNKANIKRIKKTISILKKSLQEFEQINNNEEVEHDGFTSTHPLKTRIFNYASKYVAHSIARSTIEKWEYNNEVFPEEQEIKDLVKLISRIEDDYKNFIYYWNNVVEMQEHDYSEDLESKMKKCFSLFLTEYSNIE